MKNVQRTVFIFFKVTPERFSPEDYQVENIMIIISIISIQPSSWIMGQTLQNDHCRKNVNGSNPLVEWWIKKTQTQQKQVNTSYIYTPSRSIQKLPGPRDEGSRPIEVRWNPAVTDNTWNREAECWATPPSAGCFKTIIFLHREKKPVINIWTKSCLIKPTLGNGWRFVNRSVQTAAWMSNIIFKYKIWNGL